MHFVINFRLASKYLLVVDSVCIIFATLLLYIKDTDGAFEIPNGSESSLNLTVFIIFEWQILLFTYLLGTLVYLLTRFYFAEHFYMLHNLPNMLGLMLASFYLYVTYYELDARKVFAVGSQINLESSSDEECPRRRLQYGRRHRHLRRSSRHLDDDEDGEV